MTVSTIIHKHNDGAGSLTFERVQDCSAIVEDVKRQVTEGVVGSNDMKLAARLPEVVVERYLNDNNITMHEFLSNREHIKRMCNDPALAAFRVWRGKL